MVYRAVWIALLVAVPGHAVDLTGSPQIPFDPRTYVCLPARTPPAIDGALDDPAWELAAWTTDFVDIRGGDHPTPRHRTQVKMLWDETYFYIAADMDEPHLWGTLTERDAVIYFDNDFEVFIDPDGDTHEYYELEVNALGTEWDLLLTKPYRDGGSAVNGWDIAGLKTAIDLRGTLNDPSDEDDGWSIEIAIPWASLKELAHRESPPVIGDAWRVNFSRVQWQLKTVDDGYEKIEAPEDNWVWSPQGLVNMHYPEMWGFVLFTDNPAAKVTPDPRKWELRQVYYTLKESSADIEYEAKLENVRISHEGRVWVE